MSRYLEKEDINEAPVTVIKCLKCGREVTIGWDNQLNLGFCPICGIRWEGPQPRGKKWYRKVSYPLAWLIYTNRETENSLPRQWTIRWVDCREKPRWVTTRRAKTRIEALRIYRGVQGMDMRVELLMGERLVKSWVGRRAGGAG